MNENKLISELDEVRTVLAAGIAYGEKVYVETDSNCLLLDSVGRFGFTGIAIRGGQALTYLYSSVNAVAADGRIIYLKKGGKKEGKK